MTNSQRDGKNEKEKRDSVVEAVRLGACLIVVAYHLVWAFAPVSAFGIRSSYLLPQECFGDAKLMNFLPFDILIAGNCAVAVFFVLSGYVLARPIFNATQPKLDALLGDVLKRYVRLVLPLYAFTLLAFCCFKFNLYQQFACAAAKLSGSKGMLLCCSSQSDATAAFVMALFYPFEESARLLPPAWTIGIELIGSYLTYGLAATICSSSAGMYIGFAALLIAPGYLKLFVAGTLFALAEQRGILDYQRLRQKLGKYRTLIGAVLFTVCLYVDAFPWYADSSEVTRLAPCFVPLIHLNSFLFSLKIAGGITSLAAVLTFFVCKLCIPENGLVSMIAKFGKHTYTIYLSHMMLLGTVCSGVFLAAVQYLHASQGTAFAWSAISMVVATILLCALFTDLIDGNAIKLSRWLKYRYIASLRHGSTADLRRSMAKVSTKTVILIICCLSVWSKGAIADSGGHLALEPASPNSTATRELPTRDRQQKSRGLNGLTDRARPLTYFKSLVATTSRQLAAAPNDVMALSVRGCCFWRIEKFQLAERDLERAIKLAPDSCEPEVYRVLGECYASDRQMDKAVASFTKAIEMAPDNSVYYLRRAQLNLAEKKYSAALPDANHLVTMTNGAMWTLEFRAKLNRLAGRYTKAIDDCNAALKVQPNAADIYLERAKAYEVLGNHGLAEADRKKAETLSRAEFKDLLQ
jgi:peptidoglycan/LPS O-acetylase OafA/YrhL/tetratricopeptide (TPR) repeat protein